MLLPWGEPFDSLRIVADVEVLERETSLHITWRRHAVLGGLLATASACWTHEEPNPRGFHIYLPDLHWISFALEEAHTRPFDAHRQLRRLHDHLASALGPATFSYPDYSHNLPVIFWERPSVQVSAGPVYGGTKLKITVQHTPKDHDGLAAEAEAIRRQEGDGARVDYVAWHPPFDASSVAG